VVQLIVLWVGRIGRALSNFFIGLFVAPADGGIHFYPAAIEQKEFS
jgi:hypothetical protein